MLIKHNLADRFCRIKGNWIQASKGRLLIEFCLPDATSPKENLLGNDDRKLGVGLIEIKLSE